VNDNEKLRDTTGVEERAFDIVGEVSLTQTSKLLDEQLPYPDRVG
jgi:hypothetical protein